VPLLARMLPSPVAIDVRRGAIASLGSVLADMGLPLHVGDAEAAAHCAYAQLHARDAQRKKRAA
jgi:hypothetical protein